MAESDLQTYVDEKIASGQFATPEDFATEAIRVYRQIENDHEALRQDVQRRIQDADERKLKPLDIDSIKAKLASELQGNGIPKR